MTFSLFRTRLILVFKLLIGATVMSIEFEWHKKWEIGVKSLDDEHKDLYDLINQAAQSINEQSSQENIIQILEKLLEHSKEHFRNEEYFMLEMNYPKRIQHTREHSMLVAETILMIKDARTSQTILDCGTVHSLKHWLLGHVLSSDKEMADYCINKQDCVPHKFNSTYSTTIECNFIVT
jgi:hemerythrin